MASLLPHSLNGSIILPLRTTLKTVSASRIPTAAATSALLRRSYIRRPISSSARPCDGPTKPPPATPACTVLSLDHLVLTVRDVPAAVEFYTNHLGLRHELFMTTSPGVHEGAAPVLTTRHALFWGPPGREKKINLHELGKEFQPKAGNVKEGSADVCFIVDEEVEVVAQRLEEKGVAVLRFAERIGGEERVIVRRAGANGRLKSVYLRDLDGNLIE